MTPAPHGTRPGCHHTLKRCDSRKAIVTRPALSSLSRTWKGGPEKVRQPKGDCDGKLHNRIFRDRKTPLKRCDSRKAIVTLQVSFSFRPCTDKSLKRCDSRKAIVTDCACACRFLLSCFRALKRCDSRKAIVTADNAGHVRMFTIVCPEKVRQPKGDCDEPTRPFQAPQRLASLKRCDSRKAIVTPCRSRPPGRQASA